MSTPVIDAMGRLGIWRAAHGRARTRSAHEHRAHDALANSTQLPPRPDLEFSLEFSLEFCRKLGALQVTARAHLSNYNVHAL